MPFTLAHPAIVLPLKRFSPKYVTMTGLIIGSMLPDFEYFIRMQLTSVYSHTFWGIFYFNLPLGILLAVLFHAVIRDCLIQNLPSFLQKRFSPFYGEDWLGYFKKNILVVVLSLLIGSFSHVLWDMFTHPSGYFVELFPALASFISLGNITVPIFKLLQHGSTLCGGLFILWFIYKMPKSDSFRNTASLTYWVVFALLLCLIVTLRLICSPTIQIGSLIVIAIGATMLSLLLTSFYWKLK